MSWPKLLGSNLHRIVPVLRQSIRAMSQTHVEGTNISPTHSSSVNLTAFAGVQSAQGTPDITAVRSITSNFIEANGQKIHYEITGSGKNTILLLPGALGSTRTDFGPQLENLNKDLFTVVAWDPPGYGKSCPEERDFSGNFLKNDAQIAGKMMEEIFQYKNIGASQYSVLGWSDGGITALMMAAMFPKQIRNLVVWGANAYLTEEESQFYESIRDINKWSDNMRKPFINLYGEDYFRRMWNGWMDSFVGYYFKQNGGDICKQELSDIKCPTLVIHGIKDPMIPQFHADHIHKNIKGARLYNMPEGKHNLHLRYFKEFNSVVENFLLEPRN